MHASPVSMRICARSLLVLMGLVGWNACSGDISQVYVDGGYSVQTDGQLAPPADSGPIATDVLLPDGGQDPDLGQRPDTTAPIPGPGELCPFAECTADAVCLGGLCHKICVQESTCNDKGATACAANEVCLQATSFSDACFVATAKTGQLCGVEPEYALCRAGNLCVKVDARQPRCLKLCKYGCSAGEVCMSTTNDCQVCVTP